jgi:hypothetical protein
MWGPPDMASWVQKYRLKAKWCCGDVSVLYMYWLNTFSFTTFCSISSKAWKPAMQLPFSTLTRDINPSQMVGWTLSGIRLKLYLVS